MKNIFLISAFVMLSFVTNAQLKDLTGTGQTPVASHTYYYYDVVSKQGVPFTAHAYLTLGGGLADTVTVTTEVANTTTGGWDALGTSHVIKVADSTIVWTDTLWTRNIRFKCVTASQSTVGKFHVIVFYGNPLNN